MAFIENMTERALTLLASQFKGTLPDGSLTNLQKLIKIKTDEKQNIMNVLKELKENRNIYVAEGVQLDGIGDILGLEREDGEDDANYRERLLFQAGINEGYGTPEELIEYLLFLLSGDWVQYNEVYPAAYQMATNGFSFGNMPDDVVDAIQRATPAGVEFIGITTTFDVDCPFVFGDDSELEKLWITDPAALDTLTNLYLDSGNVLYINPANRFTSTLGCGFAEDGTPIDTEGAGQFSEVLIVNGNIAPSP